MKHDGAILHVWRVHPQADREWVESSEVANGQANGIVAA